MDSRFAAKSGIRTGCGGELDALVKKPSGLPFFVMAIVWPWGSSVVNLLNAFWNSRALTSFMSDMMSGNDRNVKLANDRHRSRKGRESQIRGIRFEDRSSKMEDGRSKFPKPKRCRRSQTRSATALH